jgi:hypothetical protein
MLCSTLGFLKTVIYCTVNLSRIAFRAKCGVYSKPNKGIQMSLVALPVCQRKLFNLNDFVDSDPDPD